MEATTASPSTIQKPSQERIDEILDHLAKPNKKRILERVREIFKIFQGAESHQGKKATAKRFRGLTDEEELNATFFDLGEALTSLAAKASQRSAAARLLLIASNRDKTVIEILAKFWDLAEAIKSLEPYLKSHELTVAIGKAGYSPESIAQAVLQNRINREQSEGSRTILKGALNRI